MTHLTNAPSHTLTIAMALILDAIVVFGIAFTWLVIRATREDS